MLRGVFDGCSNKEIAADLSISENTVKTFLQQLFDKTGARTRSRLVRTAIEVYRDEIAGGEPAKGSLARAAAGSLG